MSDRILLPLLVLVVIVCNCVLASDYLFLKPYNNNACSGNSIGLGYLLIASNSISTSIHSNDNIDIVTDYAPTDPTTSDSGCLLLPNATSLTTSIFGEIGLFQFFANSQCGQSPLLSNAFKHNICYPIPSQLSLLMMINNTAADSSTSIGDNLYFELSFIDSDSALQPILNQNYGYRYTQYSDNTNSNSNDGQECNTQQNNINLVQFITNSFTTIDTNNNNSNLTFTCNNNQSFMKSCDSSSSSCNTIPLNQQCTQYMNTYNTQSC
ncbi:hypothetical protein CYY_000082 [Polysphondylium violaceum]|uniref:Transmembrane protein n=1 Tax=Polysphondylium violaceum TaxID=133409 RepID=A0A8J4Q594_9MYCE|nr:hypothetical protein CYY_000082 [Polysphondylium violaceum]